MVSHLAADLEIRQLARKINPKRLKKGQTYYVIIMDYNEGLHDDDIYKFDYQDNDTYDRGWWCRYADMFGSAKDIPVDSDRVYLLFESKKQAQQTHAALKILRLNTTVRL